MKLRLIKLFWTVALVVMSAAVNALPGPPGGSPPAGTPPTGSPPAGGPPCWAPPCIPIDGGIGLLLAAGAFVGVRRIYKGSSEQRENQ